MLRRSRIVHRILMAAGLLLSGAASSAAHAPPPPARAGAEVSLKIDPALLEAAASATQPLPVWVSFTDKGFDSPAATALALEAARAHLSPRCLERRLRAHVSPLVDERDLPLPSAYLDGLRAHGLVPYATSRWLNAVAVRIEPARLAEVAALPYVSALSLVERG